MEEALRAVGDSLFCGLCGLSQNPRVETLGYYWEEVVSASRCFGKRTEVRGLM